MAKKILVVGGTGRMGLPVAVKLSKAGHSVGILTRDPNRAEKKIQGDFQFIEGDVRSISSLRRVIREFEGVHINLNSGGFKDLEEIEVKGTANIAKAASEVRVKKITMISGLGVMEKNAWSPMVRAKLDAEKALKISGIAYTIFNCTHFMDSIPMYIRNQKAVIMGKQENPIHWLAASDYADLVVQSYEENKSDFKKIPVLGPEPLSMEEAFRLYAEHQNENISITRMSLGLLSIIATITFNKNLKYILSLMKYFDKTPEVFTRDDMPNYLSKPSTTLRDWIMQKEKQKA